MSRSDLGEVCFEVVPRLPLALVLTLPVLEVEPLGSRALERSLTSTHFSKNVTFYAIAVFVTFSHIIQIIIDYIYMRKLEVEGRLSLTI